MVVSDTLKVEFPHWTVTLQYCTNQELYRDNLLYFIQKGEGLKIHWFQTYFASFHLNIINPPSKLRKYTFSLWKLIGRQFICIYLIHRRTQTYKNVIWGKRLYCINKSKDKNSNRSFSITSPFKSHWLCRSSGTQAALWLFLQVILLLHGSRISPSAASPSRCLHSQVLCPSSANEAFLLLHWKTFLFAILAGFPPSYLRLLTLTILLSRQNTPFLSPFSPISFPYLSYKAIPVWIIQIPLVPKHQGEPLVHAQGCHVLPFNWLLPWHKTICVECFHSTC